jgi:hypothetical protein
MIGADNDCFLPDQLVSDIVALGINELPAEASKEHYASINASSAANEEMSNATQITLSSWNVF